MVAKTMSFSTVCLEGTCVLGLPVVHPFRTRNHWNVQPNSGSPHENEHIWLTPLKNMSSSVGMMTFPIYGKLKMFQTINQILLTS